MCLGKAEHMRVGALLRSLMLVMVMMLFVAACSSDESASGPITIETELDLGARPVVGTFEVTEGADTLGCSNGTSVDTLDGATQDLIKVMTCSDGTGTFTAYIDTDVVHGDQEGPWHIEGATADFAGLQGEGDFVMLTDGTPVGFETFTGDIEYAG
jgi:hypothetical protein